MPVADQLTLFQPGYLVDYTHHITIGDPKLFYLPPCLLLGFDLAQYKKKATRISQSNSTNSNAMIIAIPK